MRSLIRRLLGRSEPHVVHVFTKMGYGGAGWNVYQCDCGMLEIS